MARQYSTPTNFDDAFAAGWAFGRRPTEDQMEMVRAVQKHPSVVVRQQFERGTFEGWEFQQEWNRAECAQIIAHMAEG